jgi:hypothetical protein
MGDKIASGWITILHQRSFYKIETLSGHMLTEIYEFLQKVCGESTSDHSTVLCWSQRSNQGQDSTEDEEHSSRLRTLTTHQQPLLLYF